MQPHKRVLLHPPSLYSPMCHPEPPRREGSAFRSLASAPPSPRLCQRATANLPTVFPPSAPLLFCRGRASARLAASCSGGSSDPFFPHWRDRSIVLSRRFLGRVGLRRNGR